MLRRMAYNSHGSLAGGTVSMGFRRVMPVAAILCGVFMLAGMATQESAETDRFVVVCPIETDIHDGVSVLVKRAVREANGAQALIFVLNTPGGRLDSALEITESILGAPCKTVAFLDGMGAISAGALISYSCDEIIMSPTSNIGASQVIYMSEEGVMPAGEKETSFLRAKFAALGEEKGHNPDIGMAMVDKDIELVAIPRGDGTYDVKATNRGLSAHPGESALDRAIQPLKDLVREAEKGSAKPAPAPAPTPTPPQEPLPPGSKIILGPDKLLTLTPQEALQYRLIQHTARDIDEVKKEMGLQDARTVLVTMSWSEKFFGWLASPTVAAVLLMLGIGGLYLELKTPGAVLPAVVGIVCLVLFFGARSMIGMSGWLNVALVVVGIILLALEIFVIPGFGFVGTAGILCIIAGVLLSLTFTGFSVPRYSWEYQRWQDAMFTLTLTVVLLAVFVIATWKLLPRTPLYGHLVLSKQQMPDQGYTVQGEEEQDVIGQRGEAVSLLRPAGRGRFGDKTLQVVSQGEYIEPGSPIVIVQVDGNRYVVDRIKRDG